MSDLARSHTQAALDLLAEADGLTVYDGKAPRGAGNAVYPHVVVYPAPGMSTTDRLSASRTNFEQLLQLTYVGEDRWQCEWGFDAGAKVLDGVRPAIPGRNSRPIEQLLSRPITEDKDDPANIVCFAVVQYRISSTPA